MSRRFSVEYDETTLSHDEMLDLVFEQDYPINTGIKISTGQVARMGNIANQLGVDGDRIQLLLGNTPDGNRRTHETVYVKGDLQDELQELLTELKTAIEEDLDLAQIEAELDSLSGTPRGEQIETIGEYRYFGHETHRKARQIVNQIRFAKEMGFHHRII